MDSICFTSSHLVIRGKANPSEVKTYSAYNLFNGQFADKKATGCQHQLPYDSLTAIRMPCGVDFKEILAEGCPHPNCEVIRVYDVTTGEMSIPCANIGPHAMCAGLNGVLFICDRKTNKLRQLEYIQHGSCNSGHFKELHFPFAEPIHNVQDICYSYSSQLLFLAHSNRQHVTVLKPSTGEVVRRIGIPIHLDQLDPHICSGPSGIILLANGNRLLHFNYTQNVVHETNQHIKMERIASSYVDHSGQNKIAIKYSTPEKKVVVENIKVAFAERKIFVPSDDEEGIDTDSDEA